MDFPPRRLSIARTMSDVLLRRADAAIAESIRLQHEAKLARAETMAGKRQLLQIASLYRAAADESRSRRRWPV
jgi:hypothetical protein